MTNLEDIRNHMSMISDLKHERELRIVADILKSNKDLEILKEDKDLGIYTWYDNSVQSYRIFYMGLSEEGRFKIAKIMARSFHDSLAVPLKYYSEGALLTGPISFYDGVITKEMLQKQWLKVKAKIVRNKKIQDYKRKLIVTM